MQDLSPRLDGEVLRRRTLHPNRTQHRHYERGNQKHDDPGMPGTDLP
jgi:hypothetical protein